MISRNTLLAASIFALALLLSGCPGQDDNLAEPGLVVHLGELHLEQNLRTSSPGKTAGTTKSLATSVASASADGGYDDTALEHHSLQDGAGHRIAVYRAYIALDELALVPCLDLARLPRLLLDSLMPSAYAHAGHGSEPVGGRGLDQPNVIDLLSQDGFNLALGDMAIAPGRYCGLQLTLTRVAANAYGLPQPEPASSDDPVSDPGIPELRGRMFAFRADYCDEVSGSTCLHRTRLDFDDAGVVTPVTRTLTFATPLELDAERREGFVVVGIHYGNWFQQLDLTQLPTDPALIETLLDNIAASLYVHQKGLGGLPANIISE